MESPKVTASIASHHLFYKYVVIAFGRDKDIVSAKGTHSY